MQAAILIIEDSQEISRLVELYLGREGAQTVVETSAEAALKVLDQRNFDLLILDLNLPGMDGFEFLSLLRRRSEVPVIILSARDQDEDMVLGLALGGDEYVAKPFSPRVLVARCRALLRRKQGVPTTKDRYVFHGMELVVQKRCLLVRGRTLGLTTKEFELLTFFLDNPNKVFRPDQIFKLVWSNTFGDVSTVAVYMNKLRKKIELNPAEPEILQTLRGSGYRFVWKELP